MPNLPVLNRALLRDPGLAERTSASLPDPALLDLPEKAVQFGTGALLRGFVEFFLDEANRKGSFGGRVVAIGSTGSGRDQVFNDQDGLYTLAVQGVSEGAVVEEQRLISSLSRALSATDQWDEVLALARSPELELVFSNTTEVGIVLDEEDSPDLAPPRSFPGKLTRFLLERARAFGFDEARGVVVIPCELIEGNGDRLRAIVLALAERWGVEEAFTGWLERAVPFCNTLVDRIVPGAPAAADAERLFASLGYRDALLTSCEVYRLFAIEGDAALRRRLGFADADPGIIVTEDITPYRERKVRLLNGTHTIMVPAALLCGCETVREAMEHDLVAGLVQRVVFDETVPSLPVAGAESFARDVVDRFSNPFIRHALLDITLQATMKMRVRIVPTVLRHAQRTGRAPGSIAFGFAAFLLFMRGDVQDAVRARGGSVPRDERAEHFRALWAGVGDDDASLATLVRAVCADTTLWDADLTRVPGWVEAVTEHLARARREGVPAALEAHLALSAR